MQQHTERDSDRPPSPTEFHEFAIRLAIQAGADPERARERLAQLATVYAMAIRDE